MTGILDPGFYLFDRTINIPRIIAVPLSLGIFAWLSFKLGLTVEKIYTKLLKAKNINLSQEQIQHQIFTIYSFIAFNVFFIFGGRPLIFQLPISLQYIFDCLIVFVSSIWLAKTWHKDPERYLKESLASRFRKQLYKMQINLDESLEGRSIEELDPSEVYLLAKVLPDFDRIKRYQTYKGILQEVLDEGYLDTVQALEILQEMRAELSISDLEYRAILTVLGFNVSDHWSINLQSSSNDSRMTKSAAYGKMLKKAIAIQQEKQLHIKVRKVKEATPPFVR